MAVVAPCFVLYLAPRFHEAVFKHSPISVERFDYLDTGLQYFAPGFAFLHPVIARRPLVPNAAKPHRPPEGLEYTPRKAVCVAQKIDYAFTFIFSRLALTAGRVAAPVFLDRHS